MRKPENNGYENAMLCTATAVSPWVRKNYPACRHPTQTHSLPAEGQELAYKPFYHGRKPSDPAQQ